MHKEILTPEQLSLLPSVARFNRSFYLVGGTAIALHLGHRRSIDFDLFTPNPLVKSRIKTKINEIPFSKAPLFEDIDQIHLQINGVKVTFFQFPWTIPHLEKFENIITLPSLLSLAAMKAFALGRRAKWKDYVDLYFILKYHFPISDICREGESCFGSLFSGKMFRQQLTYYKDIDYSEPVDYLGTPVPETDIREFLIAQAIDIF
jgi:hypothetical protein